MKFVAETFSSMSIRMGVLILAGGLTACGGSEEPAASGAAASGAAAQTASAPPAEHPGKKIYNQYCFSCHGAGLSGAPKLGDAEAWAPRIAKGNAAMLKTTIEGMGAMPPRGICMACSDEELAEAIAYMVSTVE